MPSPAILAIAHTYSTKHDRNGNRYHSGYILSTETGATMHFRHVGGERNLPLMLRSLGFTWDCVRETNETVGKRQLPDEGEFEHDARYKLWHFIPSSKAALAYWLKQQVRGCEEAVAIENDGTLPQAYREQTARHQEQCMERLAEACKTWGVSLDFPGIFPLLTIEGRSFTLTPDTCDDVAAAILASPLPG